MKTLDIVKSLFVNLDGITSTGLFLIINTGDDTPYPVNLIGLKITSKPNFLDQYSISITKDNYSFLEKDSWIQTNKPNTLMLNKAIKIGVLNKQDAINLYNKFNTLNLYNNINILNKLKEEN
jgi:hypothetical protein